MLYNDCKLYCVTKNMTTPYFISKSNSFYNDMPFGLFINLCILIVLQATEFLQEKFGGEIAKQGAKLINAAAEYGGKAVNEAIEKVKKIW